MQGESPIQASRPTGAVFLSYASQDAEAAQRICQALRVASIEVWFDKSELRGGDVWDRQIRERIHDCRLFIAVISTHTEARDEGYFRREWKLAVDRTYDMSEKKAFLVPVVIDDTKERGAAVPDKFRDVQWTRLPAGETPPAFIEQMRRLLVPEASLARHTGRPAAVGSARVQTAGLRVSSSLWKTVSWVTGTLVVLALAYFAVNTLANRTVSSVASTSVTSRAQPAAILEKSIAVLPFVDLSERHDQEYFADGMAEEILNLLVKVPDLKVIGRTSSFQFKGKTDDLRKIGTALGAAYVVEGSVRRSGDHIRVTAQLIDSRDGTHRWSETYDREASDTLKVQDEIAASLVRALQLEVAGSSFLQGRILPSSSEAYDAYLRGLHALSRYDQQGFDEANADFRRALRLDPRFVPAAEQLARTLCDEPSWGFVPPRIGFEQARSAANAALKLDSHSAVAHTILGCVHVWYDWDWPEAQREMQTALSLEPYSPTVLVFAAQERIAVGQWSESLRLCETALAADPLLASVYEDKSWAYLRLKRFADAEQAFRRMLQISPSYVGGHRELGIALLMEGKPQEALAEMQKETLPGGKSAGSVLAYAALDRKHQADAELTRLEEEHASDLAMWIAEAYAFRGQKDRALDWLDRAYVQKDVYLWYIKGDPLLKTIEADPRYEVFLHKMNLPE
jgi:TolB-like protein/Tfp pilus assembly protein PilF